MDMQTEDQSLNASRVETIAAKTGDWLADCVCVCVSVENPSLHVRRN